MLKSSACVALMTLVVAVAAFGGDGKDFHGSMALTACNDCAFQMTSHEIGFGNVGIAWSESDHKVLFSSGADTVGHIEITFLVEGPGNYPYGFSVLFTDYDTLLVAQQATSEGTWFNYQWVRNTPEVIDSTVELLSFHVYSMTCFQQNDTLLVDLASYATNGWGNQYSTTVGIREPAAEDITDGIRTFLAPIVDISAWDSDDNARYMVDAGTVGGEVAIPIHLRDLTFTDQDSLDFDVAYDSDGLNFSHFVPNVTFANGAVATDGSGVVHIYSMSAFGAPVPVENLILGTVYFDIDTAATVGSEYDVWVDGESYARGCQYWFDTCNNSSEKVFVEVVADSAILKIQQRALCTSSVPNQYTLDVHILTSQYIATNEAFAANLAFSFDTSTFTNITFAGVNDVAYGGDTLHWQVVTDNNIITVQEHPSKASPVIAPGPSYQLIGQLKFNVGSTISIDTVFFETSGSLTWANTQYTDTTLTVPDANLSVIDGWIQVKYCPPDNGCPAVYSWNGTDFVMEDFVLTHSQKQSIPIAQDDYLPLKSQLVPVNGQYSIQIREFENEITHLDQVELIAVDHPVGSQIGISESGEIMTHQKWLEPMTAIDQDGNSVMESIGAEDGVKYIDEGEGSLKLTFRNPYTDKGATRLGFQAAVDQKPRDPRDLVLSDQHPDWNGVTAEIEDASGNWHYLGSSVVREYGGDGANWVFDDPSVAFGSVVAIRLSWVDGFEADVQRLLVDDGATVIARRLSPTLAEHTALGKCISAVSGTDQEVATLEPGETVDLQFAALEAPAPGMVRAFFLKTHGYYESVGTGNLPSDYALDQNYPNPFNPATTISFALPRSGEVSLAVYNLLGQEIITLVSGFMEAGNHEVVWEGTDRDGSSVASGVYFYRLTAGDYSASKKMTLVK